MSDPVMTPETLNRWITEFDTTAVMLLRMRRGNEAERKALAHDYSEGALELSRLRAEARA
jgi:hypothetical protein